MKEKVSVTWLGHACFKLKYKGWSLVIDPYADGAVDGLPPLRETADAVYCTHGHGDHSGTETITLTGGAAPADFRLDTAVCPHDDANGAKRGMNTIHCFSFGSLRVVHMGDVGCCPLDGEALKKLKGCELLLLPVGGFYTVDAGAALFLTKQIAPRAVVPMHYRSAAQGFGYAVLAEAEDFLRLFPGDRVTRLVGPSFSLTGELPTGVVVPHLEL